MHFVANGEMLRILMTGGCRTFVYNMQGIKRFFKSHFDVLLYLYELTVLKFEDQLFKRKGVKVPKSYILAHKNP